MIGGELLATGSSSCVFKPSIPCKGKKNINNDKVSKLIYGEKSLKYFNKEKKIANIVKTIKNYNKWCIISEKFCKPPTYDNIFEYDKQILDCKDKDYEKIFNESSKMIISKYGGITLEDYFIENILNDQSLTKIEINMYKMFNKMKFLFIGLKEMKNNKLIHLDIKYNNIVLDGKFFKYIDFGLSGKLNNTEHFKTRSFSEFNTKRIYIWYPLEYLYSNLLEYDKNDEKSKYMKRKHYRDILILHKLFNININEHINYLLSRYSLTKNEYNNMIKMIDTYSLGILIPYLFVEYDIIKYVEQSNFLKDVFKLCREMCNINYYDRILPDECLNRYNKIIKEYSKLNKGTKKTKKK